MKPRPALIFFLFITWIILGGCNNREGKEGSPLSTDIVSNPNTADGTTDRSGLPLMVFEETEHDFGKILEGETVSFNFKFTNKGKSDLVIADVSSSCGCTVPSYPKTPVRPGEESTIKVIFNSNGRRGYQAKNVIVVANTQPNTTLLRIKAQVVNPGSEKKQ